jgi:branched-chain amino acid transport system ATP-binding protein
MILSVENLSMSFGGLQALRDISLSIHENEILGLIGPNGSGKTVLLNCINGIYTPQQGKINFKNHSLVGIPPHKAAALGIGRTFQHVELFNDMSVIDNTLVGAHLWTKVSILSGGGYWFTGKKEEIKAREEVEELLDFLELYPYRKQKVGNLSYGTQKLVGLARAMATRPELILLDELASGLNREEKEDLARFLIRIQHERNITMIWVEHDMEMITQLADRIVCLNYGIKIGEGSPEEVCNEPQVIEAYLGSSHKKDNLATKM